jgi:DNA-binding CsgD family transcriptional regulator/tetratricopeptide (TPR) repeat protein
MADRLRGPELRGNLRGRATECALLDGLLSAIRRGESQSLVLRGEAGIGKTALLMYLVDSASDLDVRRAVGVESEMELAYASLHQLCGPMLDRVDGLPAPQRDALRLAFGLSAGPPPDRFMVGLAALSLLSEAGAKRPLLCVIDDAHWLDRASAQALAFAARRLLADPVGMVFATREPGEELAHLPELDVHGLRTGDARALLNTVVRFTLDDRVRDRIVAETRGNPLALLELPRGLTSIELADGFASSGGQPLSGRIEQRFAQQLESLSEDARRLVLLAAAEPVGDPLLLSHAAHRLGIAVSAVDAETDGWLAIGDRVTFRHPLVRSVAYRSATVRERQEVHVALAQVTDPTADPDRRAWHLAAAASGPDEQVALELERSAGRAQARGGLSATAAFLQRAVALTENRGRRAERALAAAEASLQAGAFDAALGLLATAEATALDEFQRARIDLVRGHVALGSGHLLKAPGLLLKAARRLVPFDLALTRETYLTASVAAGIAGQGDLVVEIWTAVQELPLSDAESALDLLLHGQALLALEGYAAAAPTLRRAAKALLEISVDDVLRWGWAATGASAGVWDDEGYQAITARLVQLVRDAGALAQLPLHLSALVVATSWTGDFEDAMSLVAEIESVSGVTGTQLPASATMRLLALQGTEAKASAAIRRAIEQAESGGPGMGASWAHWAAAVLYNGLGRHADAAAAAQQASATSFDPWAGMWALPELVEGAARSGDMALARDALRRLDEAVGSCKTEWARGTHARARALVTKGDTADELYREAIDRLSRTRLRPELARAHLLYGEWLRGEDRRSDARKHLRVAHEEFSSIGMEAFAERARRELRGIGEIVGKRAARTRDDLTPQEGQIARLAHDGRSNSEIGARMFLSQRTVEWHLHNVFTKLGIRSRRELASVLPSAGSARASSSG